jgi:hypothetical protein
MRLWVRWRGSGERPERMIGRESVVPDRFAFAQPESAFFARLKSVGWSPRCVFDVGASEGQWTEAISRVFPQAEFHLFEPLASASAQYAAHAHTRIWAATHAA